MNFGYVLYFEAGLHNNLNVSKKAVMISVKVDLHAVFCLFCCLSKRENYFPAEILFI